MPDRYISKAEIAELFGSSPQAAEEQLTKAGLRPINLGPGRKRGKRWLESAVLDAVRRIHEKVQPRPAKPRPVRQNSKHYEVDKMTAKEFAALVAQSDASRHLASSTRLQ